MAELQQQSQSAKGRPKRSTKVDMTAMVDVAFLLLTFFILTTSMAKPRVMELNKPPAEAPDKPINCNKMMVVYLGGEDQVHWISGCEPYSVQTTGFGRNGIRQVLRDELDAREDLIITVKPAPECRYKNVVDMLDEIKISGAPKFALGNFTDTDETFLTEQGLLK